MSKFVSKTILTSNDGLEFTEIQRDQPYRFDEKKINFMTLQEQILEQEKINNYSKDEVTKVERKRAVKPTIFDKTNPLQEDQIFKQEIFNEEDFDYFQYYGQLKEMEERNNRQEKQEIQHFKQARSKLVVDENQPKIVLAKDKQEKTKTSLSCIEIQVKKKGGSSVEDHLVKKVKTNESTAAMTTALGSLLGYDDDEDVQ